MANDEHVAILKKGVAAWNAWREENPSTEDPPLWFLPSGPNLSGADLSEADLGGANLSEANLSGARLSKHLIGADLSRAYLETANLYGANLSGANLSKARLNGAILNQANLSGANLSEAGLSEARLNGAILNGANLSGAYLIGAHLRDANLSGANLIRAHLRDASLSGANLSDANLSEASLSGARLSEANLSEANLSGADLSRAILLYADFTNADLTGCRVHGVSAWDLKMDGAKQQNLVITRKYEPKTTIVSALDRAEQQNLVITHKDEPEITVDNIEVAQFIYLLLNNPKVRDVIDTIGKKAVLILGRFTPERKAVLDALREELRKRGYVPILFDFDKPASQDLTATVSTLAHLARFMIADLTDPSSIPYELGTVVPTTPVPVQPILLSGSSEFAMFQDLRRRHHWVLTTHRYASQKQLIADLGEKVIRPAELKVLDLQGST
jgi:uncharacterized protein YjbI with pentapeptide repeats